MQSRISGAARAVKELWQSPNSSLVDIYAPVGGAGAYQRGSGARWAGGEGGGAPRRRAASEGSRARAVWAGCSGFQRGAADVLLRLQTPCRLTNGYNAFGRQFGVSSGYGSDHSD